MERQIAVATTPTRMNALPPLKRLYAAVIHTGNGFVGAKERSCV